MYLYKKKFFFEQKTGSSKVLLILREHLKKYQPIKKTLFITFKINFRQDY